MVVGLGNLPSEVQGKPSLVEAVSLRWLPESVLEEALLPRCLPVDRCCVLLGSGHCKYSCAYCRSLTKKKHIGTKRANLFLLQCPLLTKLNFVPAGKILRVQLQQCRAGSEG